MEAKGKCEHHPSLVVDSAISVQPEKATSLSLRITLIDDDKETHTTMLGVSSTGLVWVPIHVGLRPRSCLSGFLRCL